MGSNHNCQQHHGEPVEIGSYTVHAGGIRLSETTLDETDLLVTLCERDPVNLGLQLVDHHQFPMRDFGGVPLDFGEFLKATVIPAMEAGKRVTIHCQGGFGRTGTVLAGLIALLEPDVSDPVAAVRNRYCPRAVETPEQEQGITELRSALLAERPATIKEGETVSEQRTGDWYMAGTEGTGEYRVIAKNGGGRLGIRLLPNGDVRIRIEHADEESRTRLAEIFTVGNGWRQPNRQPDSQPRFSRVLPKGSETIGTIVKALASLKKCGGELTRNSAARYWRKHVA